MHYNTMVNKLNKTVDYASMYFYWKFAYLTMSILPVMITLVNENDAIIPGGDYDET